MADATLVERDLSAGREVMSALEDAGFPFFAALWLLRSETQEWSLYIGSPEVDRYGPHAAYTKLQRILEEHQSPIPLRAISLVGTADSLLRLLGTAVSVDGPSEVRFTNNVINGVLIPDAVIYRLRLPTAVSGSESAKSKSRPTPTKRTNARKSRRDRGADL
jgi:hypothetical protein